MRHRLVLAAVAAAAAVVAIGCPGPSTSTPVVPEGPEPAGDGWACFTWDEYKGGASTKVSRCEQDREHCRDKQQAAPNAAVTSGCRRVAGVWCFTPHIAQATPVDDDGMNFDDQDFDQPAGTGATCLKTIAECQARRGASDSACVERHDGQSGAPTRDERRAEIERVTAERARLAKASSTTFSCFTYKLAGATETDCYPTKYCDDRIAEARKGPGAEFSPCIEAMNVWCFEHKGQKVCKTNQPKCDAKRETVNKRADACTLDK